MNLLARLLIGGVFTYMGIFKIFNWGATAGWMAMKGLPFIPVLLLGAIIVEAGGGLWIMSGYKIKPAAIIIALFLIPTNLIFHNFWAVPAAMQQTELLSFLQNIAIIGGLLVMAVKADEGKSAKQDGSFAISK